MADPVVFRNALVSLTTATGGSYAELTGNKEVQFPMSRAELADSAMGDDIAAFHPGIVSAPLTIVHRQDFGAAGVDVKMWAPFNNRTAIKVKIRAVDSAVSSTNPSYIFNRAYVTSITPISGSHGQLLENRIEIRCASGGTLTRSTST